MVKKAVLVGCNYPGTDAELRGCINDVQRIKRSLVERFGFQEQDIRVLVDTPLTQSTGKSTTLTCGGGEPTGANIKAALQRLVAGARAGDVLFFHYSGHGVRLPVEPGDPDNTGFDECIVPSDMNLITDDDFREIVNKVPSGVTLTMISDSCHSGGLIDNEKEQIGESSLQKTAGKAGKQPPKPSPKKAAKKPGPAKAGGKAGKRDLEGISEEPDSEAMDGDGDEDAACGNMQSNGEDGHDRPHRHIFHRIRDKIHEKMEKHGIHLHRRYEELDDHFQDVCYEGDEKLQHVKSRALPLSTLMLILKQKAGEVKMDVDSIRPTLFHMFQDDASSKVKSFVKKGLAHMNVQHKSQKKAVDSSLTGQSEGDANELFKHKADDGTDEDSEADDADNLASAETRAMGGKKGGAAVSSNKNNSKAAAASASAPSNAASKAEDMGLLISGCQSHQTSADACGENNEGYGAMSNAIQIVLARNPGSITNRDLVTQVRQILKQQGFSQQPGLYCSDENAKAPFIC